MKILYSVWDSCRKCDKLALFTAFIVVNNIVAVTFSLALFYYIIMFVVLLKSIKKSRIECISATGIFFLLAILSSILVNDIPAFFKPWLRFATFLMVFLLISPVLKSRYLRTLRIDVFRYILLFLQPVVIGSFFLYFVGISFTRSVVYSGLTSHSMLLGPCCAITGLSALPLFASSSSKWLRYYYGILFVVSFLTLGLAASRGAFLSFIVGLIIFLFSWFKGRRFIMLRIIIAFGIVMMFSASLWRPYVQPILDKNERNVEMGGMASSRDVHWKQRINEFKSSPLFGIGFCAVSEGEGATFDAQTGGVETGSSWLSVLSMTGIWGFIWFVTFFFQAIRELVINMHTNRFFFVLCSSLMAFWVVHMLSEGYILAAGSFLFFNCWLTLGVIDALSYNCHE